MKEDLYKNIIGQTVNVVIDRPFGSKHPQYPNTLYTLNYGYIPNILACDGEAQDAYILGVKEPLKEFTGIVIAIIHRLNDCEDKWIVAYNNIKYNKDEIIAMTRFQEQYFEIEVYL